MGRDNGRSCRFLAGVTRWRQSSGSAFQLHLTSSFNISIRCAHSYFHNDPTRRCSLLNIAKLPCSTVSFFNTATLFQHASLLLHFPLPPDSSEYNAISRNFNNLQLRYHSNYNRTERTKSLQSIQQCQFKSTELQITANTAVSWLLRSLHTHLCPEVLKRRNSFGGKIKRT